MWECRRFEPSALKVNTNPWVQSAKALTYGGDTRAFMNPYANDIFIIGANKECNIYFIDTPNIVVCPVSDYTLFSSVYVYY